MTNQKQGEHAVSSPSLLPFPPQGSLPLPWDVPHLVKEYNIGAVVNMTIEYSGPLEQYALHGVQQLHLPTVDTAAPTLEQVRLVCVCVC